MTEVKNIRCLNGYVLVKPNEDYETIQFHGKQTGLISPNYIYSEGKKISTPNRNYSVFGKVYGVPAKIQFNRSEIKNLNDNYTLVRQVGDKMRVVNGQLMRRINELKNQSCRYETNNELQVGDTIKFSYFVHLEAKKSGMVFQTTEGLMYCIKYDNVFMTVNDDLSPRKMVNGFILVDPNVLETKKENGMEFMEHVMPTGLTLVLPTLKADSKQKRGTKVAEGKVLLAAQPLTVYDEFLGADRSGGYFEIENYNEIPIEVNPGDRILFDPRVAQQLEHDSHQEMAQSKLYLIQRKDILFFEKNNPKFAEIGLNKVNYEL